MPANRKASRRTAHFGSNKSTEAAQGTTDQFEDFIRMLGLPVQELPRQSSRPAEAVTDCGMVLIRGFQDITREWIGMTQDQVRRNLEGFNALAHCRSLQDLVAIQMDLMRNNLDSMINNGRRMAEISMQVVNEAAQTITAFSEEQVAKTTDHSRRAA